jgi:hypothetical protein
MRDLVQRVASMAQPSFSSVTLGHIRGHGCRGVLVYCESIHCNHAAEINADWLPDETPVRSLCPRMVCTACGLIGADVRPDWRPLTNRLPPGATPARLSVAR